ncbi:hypothetical protein RHSIM_Rhsim10G0161000 [Rhododendron simsii]|uniref:Retroviral polymerase SH3-like domain-containing protein n=1 Tax=Rhododendron simsii TaxID=118357 RepID=A0A834GHV3_RHOSS|nr:hypothetical protein RHSIM_Rhsim10G0161000 [Rhododendron simsii]
MEMVGYSNTSRAFRVYNLHTYTLVESANVVVDDNTVDESVPQVDDDDEGSWEIFEGETPVSTPIDIPTFDVGGEPSEKEKDVETESDVSEPSYDEELGQHDLIPSNAKEPSARVKLNHPKDLVIGNLDEGMLTRRKTTNIANYVCYTSSLEPKKVEEALSDELWIGAMQEELQQFTRNNVWTGLSFCVISGLISELERID